MKPFMIQTTSFKKLHEACDIIVVIIWCYSNCFIVWVSKMHLLLRVISSSSTFVIIYLSIKNSSANISRSPFIKLNIYSIRFVVIKTHIKTDFASTFKFFNTGITRRFNLTWSPWPQIIPYQWRKTQRTLIWKWDSICP
jgi:hypothetical protein